MISFKGFGQIIYTDHLPYSDPFETESIYKQSLLIQDSFKQQKIACVTLEILEINNEKYLAIDGRLNLYKWQNGIWNLVSNSSYHGYNFISKKFGYSGSIYSFGGYGFWREHGDLIRYDWERNEWETEIIETDQDIGSGVSFVKEAYLYIINPVSRNQHINQVNKHQGLYKINLQSHQLTILQTDPKLDALKFSTHYETNNYYITSIDPFQIINKSAMTYKYSDLTHLVKLLAVNPQSFVLIRGDSITVSINATEKINIALDSIYKNLSDISHPIVQKSKSIYYTYAFMFLVFLASIWYFNQIQSKKQISTPLEHPMLIRLMEYSGQTLSQEQLDIAFGIDQINPAETQRSKRSNLIKEINHEYYKIRGVELVSRIQDPTDKRKFLYQIR
ncbi:MAG: hypothetical protein IPK91_09465 [Saprospiraceae bacterium]|nr:hypothetical protein [Saprospiraceae bacterium]MBK8297486.1 hypothetical protein [Saprospiraceae bacterium]